MSCISNVTAYREAGKGTAAYGPYSGSVHANQIGVFARFPSDRIYFPLRPTAVYGTRRVPVLLYVTGFVSPELYDAIRADTGVTYFTDSYFSTGSDLAPFFNGKTTIAPLEYTTIKISAPADRFTEDLWIDPSPPADLVFKQGFRQFSLAVSVVTYVLFSMAASLIAGMLVFRRRKPAPGRSFSTGSGTAAPSFAWPLPPAGCSRRTSTGNAGRTSFPSALSLPCC